jgi:hypothetical protein
VALAYLFGDERWPAGTQVPELRVAAILVEQAAWSRSASSLIPNMVASAKRDDRLLESIGQCAARVVTGEVRLEATECPAGTIHEHPDVGTIAARNDLLTNCLGWTIAHVLFRSALERDGFDAVDFYLDPLQLGYSLDPSFQEALLESIDKVARRDLDAHGLSGVRTVKPRNFNWVAKPPPRVAPNRLQLGVHAAHLVLGSDSAKVKQALTRKLHTLDLTANLRDTWSVNRLR